MSLSHEMKSDAPTSQAQAAHRDSLLFCVSARPVNTHSSADSGGCEPRASLARSELPHGWPCRLPRCHASALESRTHPSSQASSLLERTPGSEGPHVSNIPGTLPPAPRPPVSWRQSSCPDLQGDLGLSGTRLLRARQDLGEFSFLPCFPTARQHPLALLAHSS